MGPQPFGCGRKNICICQVIFRGLQWGRNLSVAEGETPPQTAGSRRRLQWGRNLSVAEGATRSSRAASGLPLQWGRNLSVAEGLLEQRLMRGQRDVASMGPQPFGCGRAWESDGGRISIETLQWGRNLSVAEGPIPEKERADRKCFNGAATFRLRKEGRLDLAPDFNRELQWGRNLSVAEGLASSVNGPNTGRLQWGRNLSVAEGTHSVRRGIIRCRASMGPQPFGCGRAARFRKSRAT